MSFSMIKERPFLFAPTAPIAVCARISGSYTEEQLKNAIADGLNADALMRTRVQLADNGDASYEHIPAAVVTLQPFDCDFAGLLRQEESYVFALDKGEYTRFFYRVQENSVMLVMFLHQLVSDCDGAGFLLANIAAALTGQQPEARPVRLFESSWLPKGTSMPLNTRISNMMQTMRWKKLKKSFSWDDRIRMTGHYWGWGTHTTSFAVDALSPEDYTRLKETAKEQGVSIAAVVSAALVASTGRSQKMRYTDTLRPENCTGMGNLSVTYALDYTYNAMASLWDNAYAIDQLAKTRREDRSVRYSQPLLIPQLPPTGIDSVYFAAYDHYNEKMAHDYRLMFGLSDEPSGISITETTWPQIDAVDMSMLAAPVPPNCLYSVAIAPYMGGLILTLRTEVACEPSELNWFHDAASRLRLGGAETED